MTHKSSSGVLVEILNGTEVVEKTTTQADGSWSCELPIALGDQTFVARSGGETSDPHTLIAIPPQAITDNFDDLPQGSFSYADRDFLTIAATGYVINEHNADNNPPFIHAGKFILLVADIETRLSIKPKKLTRKVSYGFYTSIGIPSQHSVIYHYNTGEQVSLKNPKGGSWVEHEAPKNRYITEVEFILPRYIDTEMAVADVDNFSVYV
jgi:hypothetical protein